jgi:hypothetical protein
MRFKSFLSHQRLLVNLLALALALGVLVLPPAAIANEIICDEGCVAWDIQNGCTRMMSCCVRSPQDWACVEW